MRKIFIDLEMHPIPGTFSIQRDICRNETIEIGAVMLNDEDKETASFKEYVRPEYTDKIYSYIQKLTGIRWEMVASCRHFEAVLHDFVRWCGDEDYVIYAWSENDLQQVQQEMQLKQIKTAPQIDYMLSHWNDFQKEYDSLFGTEKPMSLQDAVMYAGSEYSGRAHDGLNDARTTAEVYRMTRDAARFKCFRDKVVSYFTPSVFTVADMIDMGAFREKSA